MEWCSKICLPRICRLPWSLTEEKFSVLLSICDERFVKDVDLWASFALIDAKVEEFVLEFCDDENCLEAVCEYKFPQYAYKNTSLRYLVLVNCILNPKDNVNWTSLVSLLLKDLKLIEGVIEKALSGCPNLECLELDRIWGIHRLEISNVKLRKLVISNVSLEILALYVQNLQLLRSCPEIRLKNMASLVTAVLDLDFKHGDQLQKNNSSCLKELLHSIAHVENLELRSSFKLFTIQNSLKEKKIYLDVLISLLNMQHFVILTYSRLSM
ncbi:hypothetical protein BC332_20522 [Capsicum chinense]|nr:hypothetical protein BC332_20522 [Capsicum chinense]